LWIGFSTQIVAQDSDGDGSSDADEITIGTNPIFFKDNDGDSIVDHFDPDDDNDGILDYIECDTSITGLINGSFEESTVTCIGGDQYRHVLESNVPGWETTESQNTIEIWCDGFQ